MTHPSKDQLMTDTSAKKALGQHFLFDLNLTRKIAQQAGDLSGRTVIEVGPGPGGLTNALLETDLKHLIIVEKDERFAARWIERSQVEPRLTVLAGDALQVNEETTLQNLGVSDPALIIANLPYNVGTPLLIKWLKANYWRGAMALMFQLEVAERICAAPGQSAYGRLSVIAQSRMKTKIAMRIPASAFTPPPKVDSAVVRFEPLSSDDCFSDVSALEVVTAAAFGQRRKMLRQSLKSLNGMCSWSPQELLHAANLDETARAENIDPKGFQRLALAFREASVSHMLAANAATPV